MRSGLHRSKADLLSVCVIGSRNPSQSLNTQASPALPPPNRQWLHFLAGRLVKSWNQTISSSVSLPSVIQGGRWKCAFFKGAINVGRFTKNSTDVRGSTTRTTSVSKQIWCHSFTDFSFSPLGGWYHLAADVGVPFVTLPQSFALWCLFTSRAAYSCIYTPPPPPFSLEALASSPLSLPKHVTFN